MIVASHCMGDIRFLFKHKKEKNKKEKLIKGLKDLRCIYSGAKPHPRAKLGSGIAQRYNIEEPLIAWWGRRKIKKRINHKAENMKYFQATWI